ncbi:hypothetical protein B0H11DRAFT_2099387 [Mycena galericulata]|nr:hypothetical protein B0H11DRAFT_2099387 [Mycena galericulata]
MVTAKQSKSPEMSLSDPTLTSRNMQPTTISGHDLLSQTLPTLEIAPLDPGKKFFKVRSSSTTTDIQTPPAVFIPIPPSELSDCLKDTALTKILAIVKPSVQVERSHFLATEGDVERATHLYFLHAINLIMQQYVKEAHGKNLIVTCSSQVTAKSGRIDVMWKIGDQTILILEIKRCHVIVMDHWSLAIVPHVDANITKPDKQVADGEADVLGAKMGNLSISGLIHNALPLAKQATKYSSTHAGPIVLLFDWQKLILLDLKPDTAKVSWDDDDNPARIFLSQEGDESFATCEWTHRKVLLAAFVLALKKVM